MPGRDYKEVSRRELKNSALFQEHPELYNTVCMVLYNRRNGAFINLHNLKLTQETRASIDALMETSA